ncbi:hypothetical protein yc1106_09394 [Curvularia clavata]|uniref:Uncharacterized protein n=1 Tax=Curvularia clavata TaxID=95742 RepID=A0A9Q9DXM8_CURCL|nr:hypothetical protein yc1106_09394 [Curvularia clavata]
MPEGSPRPFTVRVHPFTSPTPRSCAYEYGTRHTDNAIVYIGGLTGGPQTTELVLNIARDLEILAERDGLKYSVFEFRMRSSYTGFGYSSLKNDVEDLAALVTYLKGMGVWKKIALMGSSTGMPFFLLSRTFLFGISTDLGWRLFQKGCQAIMTYAATMPAPPQVDGYIMQAPTSDRETASLLMPADFLHNSLKHAEELIAKGKETDVMPADLIPPIFSSPITAYRWHSLISVGGDDDFFSSDLPGSTLESTFGKLDKPTVVVMSAKDEMVPPTVDKVALLKRWMDAMPEGSASKQSGVLSHAHHELTMDLGYQPFMEKVGIFLKELEDGHEKQ